MKKKILKEIIIILNRFNKINIKKIKNFNNYEYLHSGHIDSLQLIHFILLLEKKFKIKLLAKDKESANFRTIGGLVKIIFNKLN